MKILSEIYKIQSIINYWLGSIIWIIFRIITDIIIFIIENVILVFIVIVGLILSFISIIIFSPLITIYVLIKNTIWKNITFN